MNDLCIDCFMQGDDEDYILVDDDFVVLVGFELFEEGKVVMDVVEDVVIDFDDD